MAMFKNAIHYARGIGAMLVLQGDYNLWDYVDMEILRDEVKFTYSNFFASTFADTLRNHGVMCGTQDCMR